MPHTGSKAIAKKIKAKPKGEVVEVESLPKITPEEFRFVLNYAVRANGSQAVREAGWEGTAVAHRAYSLLRRTDIQQHIQAARTKLGALNYDMAQQIIDQLNDMRLADPTEMYDADGNVTDPATWPEGLKLLLVGVETEEHMTGEGEGQIMVRTKKVKLESRLAVMNTLAKILNLIKPDDAAAGAAAVGNVNVQILVGNGGTVAFPQQSVVKPNGKG